MKRMLALLLTLTLALGLLAGCGTTVVAVSYTHLTLPTILRV